MILTTHDKWLGLSSFGNIKIRNITLENHTQRNDQVKWEGGSGKEKVEKENIRNRERGDSRKNTQELWERWSGPRAAPLTPCTPSARSEHRQESVCTLNHVLNTLRGASPDTPLFYLYWKSVRACHSDSGNMTGLWRMRAWNAGQTPHATAPSTHTLH